MPKTYALIKGFLDTLDIFSDEIESCLLQRGHDVIILDYDNIKKNVEVDAAICFNNLGYSLGLPFINILMDHPFHYDNAMSNMPDGARVYCIDRNHVDFIRTYYPNINDVRFLAHAGCKNTAGISLESKIFESERDIDVLYAGNLAKDLIESLIPDFDSIREFDGAAFSGRVLERLIKTPSLTTEEVIISELESEGINGLDLDKKRYYINAFRFLDGFATSYYRELAIRMLVENGIKVHVLGSGWENTDWADNENLVLLGKRNAKEVLPYMKRSKIVLNTLTWFKDGAHDRIFNGMLTGACVVTDSSIYLKENFTDKEDIAFFELEEFTKLIDIVKELLADDKRRVEIAKSGYSKAMASHTWDNRIEEILS